MAKRYVGTLLNTVEDTTDVNVFQEVLGDFCKKLPIAPVLTIAYIHVVFNQRHILEEMVEKKVFLKKKPWVRWDRLAKIIHAANARGWRRTPFLACIEYVVLRVCFECGA